MTTSHAGFLGPIAAHARRAPERPALLAPDRAPHTYRRLGDTIDRGVAALRAAGLGRGDCVALVLPNGPELAAAILTIAAAATCAPLNPALREGEFALHLDDLGAKALVASPATPDAARRAAAALRIPIVEVTMRPGDPAGALDFPRGPSTANADLAEPDDVALVLPTSGTTSRPKSVPLTHRNIGSSAASIAATLSLGIEDRCLNVMPLFHVHGLIGALLSSLVSGGSVVCTAGLDPPSFFPWVRAFHPTWYSAVPTTHRAIVAEARREPAGISAARFRFVRSASSPLPPSLAEELERTFLCPVIEAYGMTEASHQITSNPLPPAKRLTGSVGPSAGAEVRVVDGDGRVLPAGKRGEIVVRGPTITRGYRENAEANAKTFVDGWFRTGDQGRLDARGYLHLAGRIDEIVNRGGEKISPVEVDEALLGHPAILQATAFAVPHPVLGEDLAAAVVLRPHAAVTEGELRAHVAARLAPFKVPSQVLFVGGLPVEPTGKIRRIGLAESLASALRPAVAPPDGPTERLVASVWQGVLDLAEVGRHDNFFRLGGDSIGATRVVARLAAAFGVSLSITAVFVEPTVAGLATAVARAVATSPRREVLERLLQEIEGQPAAPGGPVG